MGRSFIDLTGKTTDGGVYVKCVAPSVGGAGKHKKWICICPICNREFITQSNHLIGDKIQSCDSCARNKFEDLTGRTFTNLTVEKRIYGYKGQTLYQCKCICGNTHIASVGHLKTGTVKSCGCLKSSYAQKIQNVLEKNNIVFEKEKRFSECRDKLSLPFDFYIPEINMLVEMQGQQHFIPVKFWGSDDGLELRKNHDQIKEEYCKKHGYRLLKIMYDDDIEQRVNEEIVWPLRKQAG